MILDKIKRSYHILSTYVVLSKYLPRLMAGNQAGIPIFVKISSLLRSQKPLPKFQENGPVVMLSTDSVFLERKRKLMVIDENKKAVLHVFMTPHDMSRYILNRNVFVSSNSSQFFCFPKYACIIDSSSYLVVAEEKIAGVPLDSCDYDKVGKFIDIWLEVEKRKWKIPQETEDTRLVFQELRGAANRLKQRLSHNSPFLKLYNCCGRPFDEDEGKWPIAPSHGQTLPMNILYSLDNDQYCFIDYEPALMGYGPYGYDFAFFVLYADDLISSEYMYKLKMRFSADCRAQDWAKHFLAQIIWWSKNRKLDQRQLAKINKRSLTALALFDFEGVSGDE